MEIASARAPLLPPGCWDFLPGCCHDWPRCSAPSWANAWTRYPHARQPAAVESSRPRSAATSEWEKKKKSLLGRLYLKRFMTVAFLQRWWNCSKWACSCTEHFAFQITSPTYGKLVVKSWMLFSVHGSENHFEGIIIWQSGEKNVHKWARLLSHAILLATFCFFWRKMAALAQFSLLHYKW